MGYRSVDYHPVPLKEAQGSKLKLNLNLLPTAWKAGYTISLWGHWRRQWHPTPVLLPGKSHGRRSLDGCSPWGHWGSGMTQRLHFHFSLSCIGEGNGNPLQCSCLENPRDGGAWWAAVYGVAMILSTFSCTYSVQFICSVVSNSLQSHELKHARLPYPSPTPRACSNSCPSNRWCHPIISSSVSPFSPCLQSFPASGSFPMSQFFASGSQSTGVSASASVLPMNTHDWSPLGWTDWISLQSKGLSRVFSNTTVQKFQYICSGLKYGYPGNMFTSSTLGALNVTLFR